MHAVGLVISLRSCSENKQSIHRNHPGVLWNFPGVVPSTINSNQEWRVRDCG